jgi:hypothetical protein
MRADEIDSPLDEPVAQHVAVGRLVVDQPRRDVVGRCLVQERLNEVNLGDAGRLELGRQGKALEVEPQPGCRASQAWTSSERIAPIGVPAGRFANVAEINDWSLRRYQR